MDGAGIMNLPTEVGGSNNQNGLDSFAPLIAAQQTARDMGYPRFTRELLAAGSEMDPAEVQEFLQTIRDAGLTPEDVALMRRVVEAVFNDPNNYPEVRQRLLSEGVPEDLLPETFDLEFFTALRMAVEEAENLAREPRPTEQGMPMEGAPVEMADGGIVGLPQLKPVARAMASMGRQGDTMLAHITPQEAMMLKRMGGSGSINPYTGLPEFFLGKIVKGIGKAIKGVAKGIKKFAKSTVGRAVMAIALGAFLGPAAAGFLGNAGFAFATSQVGGAVVAGAIGGFGSSILAGDGLKNALRSGLTGAVLAGGITGITGGSAAFAARPEIASAYQQQGFLGTVRQTAANYFSAPVDTAKQMYGTGPKAEVATPQNPLAGMEQTTVPGTISPVEVTPVGTSNIGQAPLAGTEGFTTPSAPPVAGTPPTTPQGNVLSVGQGGGLQYGAAPGPGGEMFTVDAQGNLQYGRVPTPSAPPVSSAYPSEALRGSATLTSPTPTAQPFTYSGDELVSSAYQQPAAAAGQVQAPQYIQDAVARMEAVQSGKLPAAVSSGTSPAATGPTMFERATAFYDDPSLKSFGNIFYDASAKSTLGRISPALYTAGLGYLATGKPFEAPGQQPGESPEAYKARIDAELAQFRQDRPEFYGSFLPTPPRTYNAAKGSGPQGVEDFPRKNGHISGPGTGTSDDIPAMLSDGEFVFTAQAVRNMGGGSRRKGAAKMYRLMKMLEGGPVGKTAKA